jgi:hypothetical protein
MNTIVTLSTSGQEYTLPGTSWTAEQFVSTYSSSIPGIASMASEVSSNANGDKCITFRPRTGTKG